MNTEIETVEQKPTEMHNRLDALVELREELEVERLRLQLERRRRHVERRAMLPMNAARLGSRGRATGRRFE